MKKHPPRKHSLASTHSALVSAGRQVRPRLPAVSSRVTRAARKLLKTHATVIAAAERQSGEFVREARQFLQTHADVIAAAKKRAAEFTATLRQHAEAILGPGYLARWERAA